MTVFVAGLALRLVLLPLHRGQDFAVWDLASKAALRGVNFYAHHPHYPGGPYAYLPLFVYVEMPFQWLAQVSGVPFTVLGKIPILAADVCVLALLVRLARQRGAGARATVIAAAAYFLNPLVLYDGVYYGRFDSLVVALLLAALLCVAEGRNGSSSWWALSVAMKTFPALMLPGFLRAARDRRRFVLTSALWLLAICLPFLSAWRRMFGDIIEYDAVKKPSALSWQTVLAHGASTRAVAEVDYGCLALMGVGAIALLVVRDLARYCTAVTLLFLFTSKVVLEQYLVWLVPLLILLAVTDPRIRKATVIPTAVLTAVGMVSNPDIHPWGRSPTALVILLAGTVAATLVAVVVRDRADATHVGVARLPAATRG